MQLNCHIFGNRSWGFGISVRWGQIDFEIRKYWTVRVLSALVGNPKLLHCPQWELWNNTRSSARSRLLLPRPHILTGCFSPRLVSPRTSSHSDERQLQAEFAASFFFFFSFFLTWLAQQCSYDAASGNFSVCDFWNDPQHLATQVLKWRVNHLR